jgi:hypothetical protein
MSGLRLERVGRGWAEREGKRWILLGEMTGSGSTAANAVSWRTHHGRAEDFTDMSATGSASQRDLQLKLLTLNCWLVKIRGSIPVCRQRHHFSFLQGFEVRR